MVQLLEIYHTALEGCILFGDMYNDLRAVMSVVPKKKANALRKEEKDLLSQIETTGNKLNDAGLTFEIKSCLSESLSALQKKYEAVREIKMRGHQVRSRAELISGWEKPSKFLLNLEKKHYLSK